MSRRWTCRGCRTVHPRTRQKCECGKTRPKARVAAHKAVLKTPYEAWEAKYGAACNICGRTATSRRRLDRDHDHKTGAMRGLLCARCNRCLASWITPKWLRAAAAYLERTAPPS